MANPNWIGNAPAVAQVTAWVFGGTWEATDVIRIAPGTSTTKYLEVVAGSTTITTIVDTVFAALNASTIPEIAEVTWSRSSNSLVATGDTAGLPFTFTVSTVETGGGTADAQTIDGSDTSTGTNSTACSGPNFADVAANWSTGAIPVDSDDVEIASPVAILYGLDGLDDVTPASLKIHSSFWKNGATIGLPEIHGSGETAYTEYRERFLKFLGATAVQIGIGEVDGTTLMNLDFMTGNANISVLRTGQSNDAARPALCLKVNPGAAADGVVEILGGSVGVGFYGETGKCTATVASLNGQATSVVFGSGMAMGATTLVSAGTVDIYAATTVLTVTGGEVRTYGTGTHPTANIWQGKVVLNSTGTFGGTLINIGEDGELDLSQDMSTKALGSTLQMVKGATLRDPNGVGGNWAYKAINCQRGDLNIIGPFNKTYTQS